MPDWANFPKAWQEWVYKVRGEAIDFLYKASLHQPSRRELVEYACRKSAKNRIISAWINVAKAFGVEPPKASSWTSVYAMPIRIARKLGWRASISPPRYEEPKGFLLCSPERLKQNDLEL